eukprot:Sspe_Gene.65418::Locus_38732_Transcript_1_1_Confidence_1.000_Length_459::g.65418::m.65418
MPVSHASPARVPNFSYDTGPRDLHLLDSTVQKDMTRTKRIVKSPDRVRPYALDDSAPPSSLRLQKRRVEPRSCPEWTPRHFTTKRCNHLQNSPSANRREGKMKIAPGTSKINNSSELVASPVAAERAVTPGR